MIASLPISLVVVKVPGTNTQLHYCVLTLYHHQSVLLIHIGKSAPAAPLVPPFG